MTLQESYQFMAIARKTLSEMVMMDESITQKEKTETSDFLLNEATDYEILHLLVTQKLPHQKYNTEGEILCMGYVNNFLEENKELFDGMGVVLNEMAPLSFWNMSSQPAVAQFMLENDLISERIYGSKIVKDIPEYTKEKVGAGVRAVKRGAEKVETRISQKMPWYKKTAGEKLSAAGAKGKEIGGAVAEKGKGFIQSFLDKIDALKERHKITLDTINRAEIKKKMHATELANATDPAQKARIQKLIANQDRIISMAKENAQKITKAIWDVQQKMAAARKKASQLAQAGKAKVQQAYTQAKPKVQAALGKAKEFAGQHKLAVGAGLLGSALALAAWKKYKAYKTRYSKACGNLTGEAKKACERKANIAAINAQISGLKAGLSKCNQDKNPEKCRKLIGNQIAKLQKKLTKI